jgi:hypothetical protein
MGPTMSNMPPNLPPMPVQPLSYASWRYSRPGTLTAMGVISVILGILGMLGNCGGMLSNVMSTAVSSTSARSFTVRPPAPRGRTVVPTPPASAPSAGASGSSSMPANERMVVVNVMAGLRPLTVAQRQHLDALLEEAGSQIFPAGPETLTPESVRSAIRQSGQAPSGSGSGDSQTVGVADYFVVPRGRIELTDDQARFLPAGNVAAAITVTSNSGNAVSPPMFPGGGPFAAPPRSISRTAIAFTTVTSLAGTALSVYLLVIGVMVLQDSPRAGRLHHTYALLKIGYAFVAAAVSGVWFSSMMGPLTAAGPAPVATVLKIVFAGVVAMQIAFGIAYPVAILIVLRTTRVLDYYAYLQPPMPMGSPGGPAHV